MIQKRKKAKKRETKKNWRKDEKTMCKWGRRNKVVKLTMKVKVDMIISSFLPTSPSHLYDLPCGCISLSWAIAATSCFGDRRNGIFSPALWTGFGERVGVFCKGWSISFVTLLQLLLSCSSVQFSPVTSWVINGDIRDYSAEILLQSFLQEPLWAAVTWSGISTLWCCPSSISSVDHGYAKLKFTSLIIRPRTASRSDYELSFSSALQSIKIWYASTVHYTYMSAYFSQNKTSLRSGWTRQHVCVLRWPEAWIWWQNNGRFVLGIVKTMKHETTRTVS